MALTAFSPCNSNVTGTQQIPDDAPPEPTKNWGPGNYIASTNDDATQQDAFWSTPTNTANTGTRGIVQRLQADTQGHWKGALLRFKWTDLENTQGVYSWPDPAFPLDTSKYLGMAKVRRYLDQIATYNGRRLIVFIQIKTSGSANAVPAYMTTSATYADGTNYSSIDPDTGDVIDGSKNGQYGYVSGNGGPGGNMPNMHVPAVAARFDALMQAFADEFNDHPYFEALCFSEASISSPAGSPSNWTGADLWYEAMKNSLITARSVLTNVQIAQWINGPRNDMKLWAPALVAGGVGLGMPDLVNLDKILSYRNDITGEEATAPGNIQHCQNSAGDAIVMGHVSYPALNCSVVTRSQTAGTIQGEPTVYPVYPGLGRSRQAIRDFAVNTVGVTHLLWAHNTAAHPVTGARDPNAPASADPYTAYGDYGGQKLNTVTDEWIHNAGSTITTVETRPTGWT